MRMMLQDFTTVCEKNEKCKTVKRFVQSVLQTRAGSLNVVYSIGSQFDTLLFVLSDDDLTPFHRESI